MKPFSWLIIFFGLIFSTASLAVEYSDAEIRKNDFKWFQFNLYQAFDNKVPFDNQNDTFFEMEFGGRSGVFDVYGFLDVFDALNTPQSDLHNEDNLFLKFVPRFSLDGITKSNLALGPVKEWYIASRFIVGDRALFQQFIGLGTDLEVPWFGKVVANLTARYVRENYGAANEERWDGYLLDMAWFKPFYHFANKSFLTYQGYLNYIFAADKISDSPIYSDSSIEWYNGLYWHSEHYAAGYGLKYYKDMALIEDGGVGGETTGFGHFLVLCYKF